MKDKRLIPDSTFFSFFLHNTHETNFLKNIADNFYVEISPRVQIEIQRCQYIESLKSFNNKFHFFDNSLNSFSELLKPLFSKEEMERGEHDVVVVGFFCYNLGVDFIMIIDDSGARKFVKRNFPYLEDYMKWTANFLRDCFCTHKIFKKEEVLYLLNKMEESSREINGFRIDKDSLNKLIKEVKDE